MMSSQVCTTQTLQANRLAAQPFSRAACFTARPAARPAVVKAQIGAGSESGRRESMAGVLAVFGAASLVARPSQAFLGLGEEQQKEDDYKSFTTEVISDVQKTLALPKDDPARIDAIQKVRDETTKWVAKYRRDVRFVGRASYGNTYSALSALAGHYNNFGPDTNVPKKRLDRLTKELADAEKLIARGR